MPTNECETVKELGWYCQIYNPRYDGECTSKTSNEGISGQYDEVFLVNDERRTEQYVNRDNEAMERAQNHPRKWNGKVPRVHLTWHQDYARAELVEKTKPGYVGWMFGGSYIKCGDKFIALHDRQDTQEMYNSLSI